MAERVAAAAITLVGVPFRLHGRDPAGGLDCIGVIALALRAAGWSGEVPTGYPMRGGDADAVAARFDAVLTQGDGARAGDVLLYRVGPGQLHGGVRVAGGIVHADAALRRVVMRPGVPDWQPVGAWRYEETD
ncbi:peptidoglycan endopeptidase [Sphingomonas sp. A2-49]|uniref:peptidoglycan endopeptidase n=1 Tax=Sphingomonas sp. A2-49 TaxID=1391375 RepID=UPI00292EA783|nr:peptidoglycan endopeptidase [Sphingomonas sp. A2-49]